MMSDFLRGLLREYPRAQTNNARAALIVKIIGESDVVSDQPDEKSALLAAAREIATWAGDEFYVTQAGE
jgi:hypothetical protein